jgi:DNA-binding CsgD family transcriptional regulator
MMRIGILFVLLFLFYLFNCAFVQPDVLLTNRVNNIHELRKQIQINNQLYQKNIDSAFMQTDSLLLKATEYQDTISELALLKRKCTYYYGKSDVENLLESAITYKNKSIVYQNYNDEAMSHIYIAESYSFNEFYDKALAELEQAEKCIKTQNFTSYQNVLTYVNVLTSFANVYTQMKKNGDAIKSLLAVDKFLIYISDTNELKVFKHTYYSNLACIYLNENIDSAKYYALASMNAIDTFSWDNKIMALNYYILGDYFKQKNEDKLALAQYLSVYNIDKENGVELNRNDLYQSIIQVAQRIGDTAHVHFFKELLKNNEFDALQSKYNSMHKLLEIQSNTKHKPGRWVYVLLALIAGVIVMAVTVVAYKIRSINNKGEFADEGSVQRLLKMVKDNSPGFMSEFEREFPTFTPMLLERTPDLTRTEIEFCALLKLNLSTKQIAQFRFIEVRTVQNKKHRIRKRLKIPANIDLYNWFQSIN